MIKSFLSLGTNLGNRENNLREACELIEQRVGHILQRSSMIETKPQGFVSGNDFLNMCLEVETQLNPFQLLAATQDIERQMGRVQKSVDGHYHDRIIDIDILIYGDFKINSSSLIIPHPRMRERDFVMIPFGEITDKE